MQRFYTTEFRQLLQQLLRKRLRSILHLIKTFFSSVLLYYANLCFSPSAFRVFNSRSFSVPVFMAGIWYILSPTTELALCRVSDENLIRRKGLNGAFSSFCRVEISLDVSPLNLAPAKNFTLPIASSCLLKTTRSVWGFAVAIAEGLTMRNHGTSVFVAWCSHERTRT